MPPTRHLPQASHKKNTIYNRVRGNQANYYYGDITHISDSYNTIMRNNYGSNNPTIHNSDIGNSSHHQEPEGDTSEIGKIAYGMEYPLSTAVSSSPGGDLAQHQQSYPPLLHPQNSHSFQSHLNPNSQSFLPHDFHSQSLPEGHLLDPLLTPATLAFPGRMQTITYNNVQGSQTIHYHNQTAEKEYTVYDEYRHLKSGDVYKFRDIHQEDEICRFKSGGGSRVSRAKTMICHAEVQDRQGFTAVFYEGEDAKELWKKDFEQFAEQGNAKWMQLFGLNGHSSVPFLIFHSELIPIAHIIDNIQDKMTGQLVEAYAICIADTLGTRPWFIWLDSKTNTLIRGMSGPFYGHMSFSHDTRQLLSKIGFHQRDVIWQYLVQMPSNRQPDKLIVDICDKMSCEAESSPYDPWQMVVVSILTNSPIAIAYAYRTWKMKNGTFRPKGTILQDGTTRFSLASCEASWFHLKFYSSGRSWLAQATSVFHQLGITLDQDLSQFKLNGILISLEGWLECSDDKLQRRKQHQFIYIFIPPTPAFPNENHTFVSTWHYWSFDSSGQCSIPEEMCEELGLPIKLELDYFAYQCCFPTETYKIIHRWQVERGFDPKTTDFARYLYPEWPLFQVIDNDASHFTELDHEDA